MQAKLVYIIIQPRIISDLNFKCQIQFAYLLSFCIVFKDKKILCIVGGCIQERFIHSNEFSVFTAIHNGRVYSPGPRKFWWVFAVLQKARDKASCCMTILCWYGNHGGFLQLRISGLLKSILLGTESAEEAKVDIYLAQRINPPLTFVVFNEELYTAISSVLQHSVLCQVISYYV